MMKWSWKEDSKIDCVSFPGCFRIKKQASWADFQRTYLEKWLTAEVCEGTNVKSQKAGGLPGVLACALKPSTGVAEAEGCECKAGLDKTGKSCIETKTNQWSFPNPV